MEEDMMKRITVMQTGQAGLKSGNPQFRRQQGVALIISMILLAVITLLSVTAMRGTNLDAKIAANHQHKQLSFQAAENAIARLTGDNPQVSTPTIYTGTLRNADYIYDAGIDGKPDTSADLDLTFVRQSAPGEYKFSGYSLDASALIYTADAYGKVNGSNARSQHRVTVVLVRN